MNLASVYEVAYLAVCHCILTPAIFVDRNASALGVTQPGRKAAAGQHWRRNVHADGVDVISFICVSLPLKGQVHTVIHSVRDRFTRLIWSGAMVIKTSGVS